MEYMYELKEKLCQELDEIARKGELGAGDLEIVHKLTDTIKNLDKIEMLEDDGYSQEGYSREGGNSYARGSSYANRGKHYVRGHYSRDGRGGYSRDGRMGGYSRHDAKEAMMEQAHDMMDSATSEREREAIRRFMAELERD
jgi:hypothetical protein